MTRKIYDETGLQVLRPEGTNFEHGLRAWIAAIPPVDRGVLVEVGTWRGEAAVWFAKYFREVICVDSWVGYDAQMQDFISRTRDFANIRYIRSDSITAAKTFDNATLDAVYIDANHQWKSVCADINAWSPKVRKGGYVGGHDYVAGCAVKAAVDRYYPDAQIFEDTSWLTRNV